ncbi:unnamed protein product [Chrysoparadoxa australica]
MAGIIGFTRIYACSRFIHQVLLSYVTGAIGLRWSLHFMANVLPTFKLEARHHDYGIAVVVILLLGLMALWAESNDTSFLGIKKQEFARVLTDILREGERAQEYAASVSIAVRQSINLPDVLLAVHSNTYFLLRFPHLFTCYLLVCLLPQREREAAEGEVEDAGEQTEAVADPFPPPHMRAPLHGGPSPNVSDLEGERWGGRVIRRGLRGHGRARPAVMRDSFHFLQKTVERRTLEKAMIREANWVPEYGK